MTAKPKDITKLRDELFERHEALAQHLDNLTEALEVGLLLDEHSRKLRAACNAIVAKATAALLPPKRKRRTKKEMTEERRAAADEARKVAQMAAVAAAHASGEMKDTAEAAALELAHRAIEAAQVEQPLVDLRFVYDAEGEEHSVPLAEVDAWLTEQLETIETVYQLDRFAAANENVTSQLVEERIAAKRVELEPAPTPARGRSRKKAAEPGLLDSVQ